MDNNITLRDKVLNMCHSEFIEFIQSYLHLSIDAIEDYIKLQKEKNRLCLLRDELKKATLIIVRKHFSNIQIHMEYEKYRISFLSKKIKNNTITEDENNEYNALIDKQTNFFKHANKYNIVYKYPGSISDFFIKDYFNYFKETQCFNIYKNEKLIYAIQYTEELILEYEATKPLPPPLKELTQEQIKKLELYFIPKFKGIGNNQNDFENLLIPELNKYVNHIKAKDCARIAAIIFDSKYFKKTNNLTYNKWLNEFYDIMGIKTKTMYKRKVLEKEEKLNELIKKFSYLDI